MPADSLLGERGAGFAIAQDRLGPGPHPPLHARDRLGRARLRADVQARPRPRVVRRPAGREAVRPGLHRQVADGDRRGAADGAARGLEDGHRGQARRAPGDLDDQGDRRADAPARCSTARCRCTARSACPTTRRSPPCGARAAGCGSPTGPDEVHKMVIALRELNRFKPREPVASGRRRPAAPRGRRPTRELTDEQQRVRRGDPRLRGRASGCRAARGRRHSDEVAARMGELGWYGLQIPEEYGGSGGSFLDATLFLEETARGQIPVAAYGVTLIVVGALEPLRHRGAEARPARPRGQGRHARDRDVRARGRLRRGRAQDARPAARTASGCSTGRRCGAPTPTRPATS